MNTPFWKRSLHTARTPKVCPWCKIEILPGQAYEKHVGWEPEEGFYSVITHPGMGDGCEQACSTAAM